MPTISRILMAGGGAMFSRTINISTLTPNYVLRTAVLALGWNGIIPVSIICNINESVYSADYTQYALTISDFPASSRIYLNIASGKYLAGAGGIGGGLWYQGSAGGPGGTALYTRNTTIINNLGTIGGGGGGGGSGRSNYDSAGYTSGGGGGGGQSFGIPGVAAQFAGWSFGQNGSAGTLLAPGAGGSGGNVSVYDTSDPDNPVVVYNVTSGDGGSGGTFGQSGSSGTEGNGFNTSFPSAVGGAGGNAIDGYSYCTISVVGSILGSTVN